MPRGFFATLGALFRGRKPEPAPEVPGPPRSPSTGAGFLFDVEDVFSITGRGTVATGRVTRGRVAVGDEVRFRSSKGVTLRCRVNGIEMFGKTPNAAKAGDTAGLLLSKVGHEDLERGTTIEAA